MRNMANYLVSLLLGLLIILSVAGLPVEIFGYTKVFAVFSVAGISLIIVLLSTIAMKKKIKITQLNIFYFLFLSFYLIDFSSLNNLWNVGFLCLLSLFVAICLLQHIHYTIIFKCSLCATVLLTSWGYMQYFQYIPSNSEHFLLTGPFHNPAVLAIMLSLLLGIVLNSIILFYNLLIKNKSFLILVVIIVIFCMPLFILTNARAAYLALFISILYSLYLRFGVGRKKAIYLIGLLPLILISIGILYKLKPQSADGRLLVWKISCKMIQDKPLTGFGKGGFAANYLYYQADYMRSFASPAERDLAGSTHLAFNEPLRITVEYGVIGLIIYSLFVVWLLFLSPNKKSICILFKSLLIGIVTWSMFGYPDQVFSVQTLWVVAIACYLNKIYGSIYKHSTSNHIFPKIVIVVMCCASGVLSVKLWNKWTVYHELYICLKTHTIQQSSHYSNMLTLLRREITNDISVSYLYCQLSRIEHQKADFFYMSSFLEEHFPTPGLLIMKGDYLKEIGKWKEAEEAYKLASDMMPSLQIPCGKLAFLYNEIGRKEEAITIARNILTEDVKVYGFDTFNLHRDLNRIFEDELK